nr:cilia- and flagella-associated protein 206-like isoform X2 [Lepeophtheirus salmonis]
MDPSKTKSITWDLVEEILKECEYRDEETQVSEILAAFTLKLAFQDPVTGYKENEPLSESDVDELVENCIQRILFDFSPSMETIRMQAEYLGQYKSKESILSEHSKALDHRLAPLTRTVVEDSSRTLSGREELYQKIVLLCVLRSGLGDPRDKFVMRESTLAVKSVFPFSELEHFMKKEHKLDKRQHLIELSSIVGGIRIFNWQAKQGTAQFEDLPPMLSNALEATLRNMECMMDYAEEKIKKMRDIGLNVFYFSKENEGHEEKEEYMDPRYKTIIRDSLINYVQFQKYLKVIYEDVLSIRSRLIQYNKQLPRALNAAEKIITSKPILPTIDVFPKFMTLSKIWHQYQEEIIVLSYFNSLNQKLHSFTRSITKSTSLKKLKKLANSRINKKKITFAEEPLIFPIPKASERLLEFKLHYACNVIPHDDVYQVFEFDNGYCPVALAETGLLLKVTIKRQKGLPKHRNPFFWR